MSRRAGAEIDRNGPREARRREARRRLRDARNTNPGAGGGSGVGGQHSEGAGREGGDGAGEGGKAGTSMGVMQSLTVLTVISSAPRMRLASA